MARSTTLTEVARRRTFRRRLRLGGAVIATTTTVIYLLIATHTVEVVDVPIDENVDVPLLFGAAAATAYGLGALLLARTDRRPLWVAGALLQIFVIAAYLDVAAERVPAYEGWGITLRVLQVALFVILVVLATGRPEPDDPLTGDRHRGRRADRELSRTP